MSAPTNDLPQLANEHGTIGHAEHHEKQTRWVVVLTAVMMVIELVIGRLTGSLALTADGWHMATHVGALGLSALAYWFARTRASTGIFSFGTGKVYALAGYTNAIVLAFVAVWIMGESVTRLLHPVTINFSEALPVAILGLIVNLVSVKMLEHNHPTTSSHDHVHPHKDHSPKPAHDHNLRAAYAHVLADAFTSVLAIGSLLVGRYFGWVALDPLMGVVGGVVIVRWSVGLCRDAARHLLDASPAPVLEQALRSQLETIDDVQITDFHLWEMGPNCRGCIVSLVTSTPRETMFYRDVLRRTAALAHLTVEVHQRVPLK